MTKDQRGGHPGDPDLGSARAACEQQPGEEREREQQRYRGGVATGGEHGERARHRRRYGGAEHAQHAQPVGPGSVGERGLQRTDRGREPQPCASGSDADRQGCGYPDSIASRHGWIGLRPIQAGSFAQQAGQR